MDPFLNKTVIEHCSENLYTEARNWTGKRLEDFSLQLPLQSQDQPYHCGGERKLMQLP